MTSSLISVLLSLAVIRHGSAYSHSGGLTDAFLRQMVDRMGSDLADPDEGYIDLPGRSLVEPNYPEHRPISSRDMKESIMGPLDYDDIIPINPSVRDPEFLAHSSLLGSMLDHYMPSDTKMRLKPLTTGVRPYETKSEGVLPAYCNPPNPCPVGYTAEDGCLEDFQNTAVYSREYQAMQDCMCDTEHMFECQDSSRDSGLTALARSIQNEGIMDSQLDSIVDELTAAGHHELGEKYHFKKNTNPFLDGERLPVAAKKGHM